MHKPRSTHRAQSSTQTEQHCVNGGVDTKCVDGVVNYAYEMVDTCTLYKDLWEWLKTSPPMMTKGEKINLGKYNQTLHVMRRDVKFYAVKGWFYSITADHFGWKIGGGEAAPKRTGPGCSGSGSASSASHSVVDVRPASFLEGRATLKQIGHANSELTHASVNQLHKASIEYCEFHNLFKSSIITSLLGPLGTYLLNLSKKLREHHSAV